MIKLEDLKLLIQKNNEANTQLLDILKHQGAAINVLQGKVHNLECTLLATAGILVESTPAHISNPAKNMIRDFISYSRIKEIKRDRRLVAVSEK